MLSRLASLEHRRESRILRRLERASADEVQHHADEKLADMLIWSRQRVPYYRQFLVEVPAARIRKHPAEVLQDLPVLNKVDLHEHFEELTADGRPGIRVRRNATGGSTGETAQFLQDAAYRRWNRAVLAHFESWTGWRPGDSKTILWGIPRDVERAAGPVHRVRDRLLNRTTLNAYNMSPKTMDEYAALLRRKAPDMFRVFPQSGVEFARYLLENGAPLRVGAVTCSSSLLRNEDRDVMQRAFGAQVRDIYGSREVGPIAAEHTPAQGLYISPATHRLEILRSDGSATDAGEEGEIHVSLLVNRVMPLLRYRIGDRGAWAAGAPPAGAPAWPRLGRLVGRTMEHVVAADGTLRNSQVMTELVMRVAWIRRFQWIQHARNRVELRLEPHPGHPAPDEKQGLQSDLARDMRRIIGPDCELQLTLCDRIVPSASGKYRYVICKVH